MFLQNPIAVYFFGNKKFTLAFEIMMKKCAIIIMLSR
ncbi:hypothetical protein OXPF_28320 [Oxobacter pfennigii]|uniref:Uncharacterized protein n=1 Tax=Oxobacter pfennigii TaxID=36849 RepID=A0A0P8W6L0_9CLOT|nr:hypothetical protein OXPF_28320 [Oxobacter pfennigii]